MDEKILANLDKGRGLQMEIKLVKVENEEFIVFKDVHNGAVGTARGIGGSRAYVFPRNLVDGVGSTLLALAAGDFSEKKQSNRRESDN